YERGPCKPRIEGEVGAEQRDRQRGERRRHAAVALERHVKPGHAADEGAEAPGEAERETLVPARRAAEQPGQHAQAKEGERKQVEGREREHRRAAREQRGQQPARHHSSTTTGLGRRSTTRVCTRRLSARSTWILRPSSSTASPRLGRRPKW